MEHKRINFNYLASGVIVPILIAAVLGVGYFAVLPQYQDVKESRTRLVAKQAAVSDRKASVDSIKSLVADLEKKRETVRVMDEALPSAPDIPGLLVNIEYLAVQSGMVLENLQVQSAASSDLSGQTKKQPNSAASIIINLTVQGIYPQFQALLLNIEKNLRLLDVKTISFGQMDADTGERSYGLQLVTYYYSQKP